MFRDVDKNEIVREFMSLFLLLILKISYSLRLIYWKDLKNVEFLYKSIKVGDLFDVMLVFFDGEYRY